jgi:predicted dehydrogenase
VLGIDPDPEKNELARRFGAETVDLESGENPLDAAAIFSRGKGVDGVLLTLASKSDDPVSNAAKMCRKRGRIVLVGVTGLQLNRSDFYEKELTFQVSCSYGPGRYDPDFESKGRDYPFGFVRWTEQRNFEAVLDLIAKRRLDLHPLISHRFKFHEAQKAYELLTGGKEKYLGILLEYGENSAKKQRKISLRETVSQQDGPLRISVVGAGNYAGSILIPAFKKNGVLFDTLVNSGGINGPHYARKFGFEAVSSDLDEVIRKDDVSAVIIATRHDSHANYVSQLLCVRKHVFVEKPLALTLDELDEVEQAYQKVSEGEMSPLLMVGFNRRFSPLVQRMTELLNKLNLPRMINITVNAGKIPSGHWTQDPSIGGRRIIGEGCHFIDLARHLAKSRIEEAIVRIMKNGFEDVLDDKAMMTLTFENGSVAQIQYLANGHSSYPKERIELFSGGRVLQLNNFLNLEGWGWPGFRRMRLRSQDKGQNACVSSFVEAIRKGEEAPIPFKEIMEVSRIAVQLGESARK